MKVGVKADYQKYKHWAPWTSLVKIKGMDTQMVKLNIQFDYKINKKIPMFVFLWF